MRNDVVLPFRTLGDNSSALNAGQWFTINHDRTDTHYLDPSEGIKEWSYDMPLIVGRELTLHPEAIREELALDGTHASFDLLIIVKTGDIGNRRLLKKIRIQGTDSHQLELEIPLDSSTLCQHITLITSLVLAKDIEGTNAWAPDRKGSRLWEDDITAPIEGSNGRFPMRDIDFNQHHKLPADADWHLDWQPSLTHYSFNSAVSLLLNSAKTDFLERLQAEDEILTRTLMGDIVCEISTHLVMQDNFTDPDEPFPTGSLGQVVSSWLQHAFPGDSLTGIRNKLIHTPNLVNTRLRGITAQL